MMKAANVNGKLVPAHVIDRLEALSLSHSMNDMAYELKVFLFYKIEEIQTR